MSEAGSRAAAAERLKNDPLLVEAFASIRNGAITAWQATKIDDARARDMAWLTVKVVDRIEGELQSIIDNGKLAARRVQAPLR